MGSDNEDKAHRDPVPPAGEMPPGGDHPAEEATGPLGLTAAEERFVTDLTDASLAPGNQLHELFLKAFFSGVVPDGSGDDGSDDEEDDGRFKTAAEVAKEAEMRAELADLMGEGGGGARDGDDDDDGSEDIFDFDKISENEDAEREEELEAAAGVDSNFLRWINEGADDVASDAGDFNDEPAAAHPAGARRSRAALLMDPTTSFVDVQMDRIGVGLEDDRIAKDPMPERLAELAAQHERANLGAGKLPTGETVSVDRVQEAAWIVARLVEPHGALHGTTLAANFHLLDGTAALATNAVTVTVAAVLELVTVQKLEPAAIMLHHQTLLAPLLHQLWHKGDTQFRWAHESANPDLAYCEATGRRLQPLEAADALHFNRPYVGFHAKAQAPLSCNVTDGAWESDGSKERAAVRKPCAIELGRLLWEVVELDVVCHNFEKARMGALKLLRNAYELDATAGSSALESNVQYLSRKTYGGALDAAAWAQYAHYTHAAVAPSGGASTSDPEHLTLSRKLADQGLARLLADYTITPSQFQQNVLQGFKVNTLPHKDADPLAWAATHLRALDRAESLATGELLGRLGDAVAEGLILLPVLRRRVYDRFEQNGVCVVTPTVRMLRASTRRISVSALLLHEPRTFLEILEEEAAGRVVVSFEVPRAALHEAVQFDEFVAASIGGVASEQRNLWEARLEAVKAKVVRGLAFFVQRFVRGALVRVTETWAVRASVRALGGLCQEGPYEKTRLALEAFQPEAVLWDEGWDAVEALPVSALDEDRRRVGHARVCAVYRDDATDMVVYSCVDARGVQVGHVRWVQYALVDALSRKRDEEQTQALKALVERALPEVFAVAVSGPRSAGVFRDVKRFVKEHLVPTMHIAVPVVWAGTSVAHLAANSVAMKAQLPTADAALRIATCVAQHVQNPLHCIARLFDHARTALKLPLGMEAFRSLRCDDRLYAWLSWEMSLWTAAVGVDINRLLTTPRPELVLQFAPGFGYRKAKAVCNKVCEDHEGSVRDRQHLRRVMKEALEHTSAVWRNVDGAVRIYKWERPKATTDIEDDGAQFSLLDRTLIPTAWYPVAEYVAGLAEKLNEEAAAKLAIATLFTGGRDKRFASVSVVESQYASDIANDSRNPTRDGQDPLGADFGMREIQFIADELVAAGASSMRRPFRLMTAPRYFKLTTSVSYFQGARPAHSRPTPLVMREGDIIEGTYGGLKFNKQPHGIKIKCTNGCTAIMFIDDIKNPVVKAAVEHDVKENLKKADDLAAKGAKHMDGKAEYENKDIAKGMAIAGKILGVKWDSCELRLEWAEREVPLIGFDAGSRRQRAESQHSGSIRTNALVTAAAPTASAATRHLLFRNWPTKEVMDMLEDDDRCGIFEYLLHPTGQRRAGDVVITVRVGSHAFVHLPIFERRGGDGKVVYEIRNHRRDSETKAFSDLDHCIDVRIKRMVTKAKDLRTHRKFYPEADAEEMLALQTAAAAEKFAYVLTEVRDRDDKVRGRYEAWCSVGPSGIKRLRIQIEHDSLVLQHKAYSYNCKNADKLCERLKDVMTNKAPAPSADSSKMSKSALSAM
jgi:hypothetical protein